MDGLAHRTIEKSLERSFWSPVECAIGVCANGHLAHLAHLPARTVSL